MERTGHSRHGIGMIVPFDFALDAEYWAYLRDAVTIYITRTSQIAGDVGVDLAEAVADLGEVTRATRSLIAPHPDAIAYACTSGSFVGGASGERALREAMMGAGALRALTTSGALLRALSTLGANKIALAAPYPEEVGQRLVAFLVEAGLTPVSLASLGLKGGIADVPEDEVVALARAAMRPEADALFISCTNLATLDAIPFLEAELGVPVLSANQVTMWALLQEIGAPPAKRIGAQRLFQGSMVRE